MAKYQKKLEEDIRCPLEYGLAIFGGKWRSRIICVLSANEKLTYSQIFSTKKKDKMRWYSARSATIVDKEKRKNVYIHRRKEIYKRTSTRVIFIRGLDFREISRAFV